MADKQSSPRLRSSRLDIASVAGLVVALGGIVGGLVLEGGRISDVAQITAAIIVLAGTLGAVMITSPMSALLDAAKGLKDVFIEEKIEPSAAIEEIIAYATKARKSSIVSLEDDLDGVGDDFLRKALSLAVDGVDLRQLREMMEMEIVQKEHHQERAAKVFESAGGYAPTIGIIGAVLGLIQVMKHLENIDEVGRGIAVAFVATVYGVAASNLFFLPAANKLKSRAKQDSTARELLLEGVCSMVEGMNPKLIRVKLEAFVEHPAKEHKKTATVPAGAHAASVNG
jgi:chemotaxis protein MotA